MKLFDNQVNIYLKSEIHGRLGCVRQGCNRHSHFEIGKDFNNGHFVTYPVD